MSGGSFNYLYLAVEIDGLSGRQADLRSMAEALAKYPDHGKALGDTLKVIRMLQDVEYLARGLADVWQAVEWHRSCDSGPDSVAEALAEYDEAHPPTAAQNDDRRDA